MKKNNFLKKAIGITGVIFSVINVFAQNSNPYPTSGPLGLGTASPQQPLHVVGKARFDVNTTGAGGGRLFLTRPAVANYENFLSFGTNGTTTYEWTVGTANGASDFGIYNWTWGRTFSITTSGNTSIGNLTTALAKLHVGGDIIASTATTGITSAGYIKANTVFSGLTTPDYTWYNDLTTGIFHPSANAIGFTLGGSEKMRIHTNGFVGIGTALPTEKLQVHDGAIKITGANPNGGPMVLFGGTPTSAPSGEYGIEYTATDHGLNFWKPFNSHNVAGGVSSGTNYIMFISDNGNVGIGTLPATLNATGYVPKLSVNGTIRAKEVIVETGWADFVFEKKYALPSLNDVELFISKNGHLPDVPSAEEVSKNGVSIGKTEALLLQKIEELTLYMIDLNKKNQQLEKMLIDSRK